MIGRQSKFEKRLQVDVPALLAALGIDDVRRNGRSIEARCPSHPDKSPSWSIVDDPRSARNGLHHCFSCLFGGGPVSLVREVRQCSTQDAVEWLKGKPRHEEELEVDVVINSYRVRLHGSCAPPEGVRVDPIEEWPEEARDYLLSRGVTERQIVEYGIGYATRGRLSGRVVIPAINSAGKLLSYTARDYTGRSERRYLEPRPGEGAVKTALFGEHRWSFDDDVLVVTEGCFDALAVDRLGLEVDTCALRGSRMQPVQAAALSRFKTVVVATDPDPAGERAAEELAAQLSRYSRVRRAEIPAGLDCASLPPEMLRASIVDAMYRE